VLGGDLSAPARGIRGHRLNPGPVRPAKKLAQISGRYWCVPHARPRRNYPGAGAVPLQIGFLASRLRFQLRRALPPAR
jgi:hypothetical protein